MNQAATVINGEAKGDFAGSSVDFVGDLDGDGQQELLVGAWGNNAGGTHAGRAYILFSKDMKNTSKINLSDAFVLFTGESAGDKAGSVVAGVGDVNGDGLDDVAVSAPHSNHNRGTVYVFSGAEIAQGRVGIDNVMVILDGEQRGDFAGSAITGLADLDLDGQDELLISAMGADDKGQYTGATYVVFGGDLPTGRQSLADARFVMVGQALGDTSGASLAALGDVDHDGLEDFAVGAPQNDAGSAESGMAALFLGADLMAGGAVFTARDATLQVQGHVKGVLAGSAVAGGDMTGNGLADFAVALPLGGDQQDQGAISVFFSIAN